MLSMTSMPRYLLVACLVAGVAVPACKTSSETPELERFQPALEKDPTIAADPNVKSCVAGDRKACAAAADALARGNITGKEEPEARVGVYAAGCRASDQKLCGELANALLHGYGASVDGQLAFRLLVRSCDANEPVSCALLGRLYQDGAGGVPVDEDKAKATWEKGCALHDRVSCSRLERLRRHDR